jgi:hypothetical protein
MNSRGWKISLLVVSALALSACGNKKKHRPNSPYQGIWMEQRSIDGLARSRGAWDCGAILSARKAFIVQPTGEVFTYVPDARLSAAEAREYYLGAVNEASIFAPIDGQRLAGGGYYSGDMNSVGLQPNSRFILDQGVLIAQSHYGHPTVFVQVSPEQARRVWVAGVRCQSSAIPVQPGMMPPGPGPGPGQQFIDQGFQQQQQQPGQRPLRQDDK